MARDCDLFKQKNNKTFLLIFTIILIISAIFTTYRLVLIFTLTKMNKLINLVLETELYFKDILSIYLKIF